METLYGYLIGALVTLAICAFAWARQGWRGSTLAFILQMALACGFYYGAGCSLRATRSPQRWRRCCHPCAYC